MRKRCNICHYDKKIYYFCKMETLIKFYTYEDKSIIIVYCYSLYSFGL